MGGVSEGWMDSRVEDVWMLEVQRGRGAKATGKDYDFALIRFDDKEKWKNGCKRTSNARVRSGWMR